MQKYDQIRNQTRFSTKPPKQREGIFRISGRNGILQYLYSDKFKYACISIYCIGEAVCYLNCFCFNFKVVYLTYWFHFSGFFYRHGDSCYALPKHFAQYDIACNFRVRVWQPGHSLSWPLKRDLDYVVDDYLVRVVNNFNDTAKSVCFFKT